MSFSRSSGGLVARLAVGIVAAAPLAGAQVTTSSLAGRVTNVAGEGVVGATVTAVHVPSGTTYRATTRADGRYTIPGMRVGGPYRVVARALGYAPGEQGGFSLSLGVQADVDLRLQQAAVQLTAITVTEATGATSTSRTGAATRVGTEALETLPTISRTIGDFTRLTPQASGGGSFAGTDNRLNNITIDGAFFNNSFGLSGQPGGRTGVAPIPLDAVEQIQVNIAPYDVRQGNFVGAGVNAVTRSGTNNVEGSVYYLTRNEDFVGTRAGTNPVNPGTFSFGQIGARIGGPIIKNRLFVFANFEDDGLEEPGTTFRPNAGGQPVGGNVTRVLQSDVDRLSQFLGQRFDYQTGSATDFQLETPSRRFLTRVDFNANDRNKFSLRYSYLNSSTDIPVSNSTSLGFGNRRDNQNSLSFANSGYSILENIRSTVGEWNSQIGARASNQLIVGYTSNDESRGYKGEVFPTVDILRDNQTYLSFGFEPFTLNNELRYQTFQLQNNFSFSTTKHDLTVGATFEQFNSENVFFQASQSVYTYNSLDDFFTDANDYLANPNRTTSPVALRRFEVAWNNVPGQEKPVQPLEVRSYGAYLQDIWRATSRLQVTAGLRMDLPIFSQTALANTQAAALTFRDRDGAAVRYRTDQLPGANILWSPRLGFNWDVRGDRTTLLRGGTGVFSGRPPFVWISNQVGNNGILTGFERVDNTTTRPFNPNPDAYKPTNVTGAPASRYALAYTSEDYRFPQVWRSNLAVDQRLPWGVLGTVEFLYGRDVNGAYYINANLPEAQGRLSGPDTRPRWTNNRIQANIDNAVVLQNQNVGYNWNLAGSLEKAFSRGFFAKAAYNYGEARNQFDPGSIAFGSWSSNQNVGDPNNPPVAYSQFTPGHRAILALSYRREYLKLGATTISFFGEGRTIGNASYTVAGDLNGDGGPSNDLVYVPRTAGETVFEQFTTGTGAAARTFTVDQQRAAWEAFIAQDEYLSSRRGQYAERGAVFLPMFWRADVSIAQDIFRPVFGKRNAVQLRLDVINATNLINRDWGVAQRLVNAQPLLFQRVGTDGQPVYRFRTVSGELLRSTFERTASLADVYRLQLGLRYTFQ
jgi:hypothetical protein